MRFRTTAPKKSKHLWIGLNRCIYETFNTFDTLSVCQEVGWRCQFSTPNNDIPKHDDRASCVELYHGHHPTPLNIRDLSAPRLPPPSMLWLWFPAYRGPGITLVLSG
jgi:hypothetical protein